MKEFKGKVAVITGAGSGIGRALALKSAQEGMCVVLAGIEAHAIAQTEQMLKEAGASTLAVQIDVTKPEDWERLARRAMETFNSVDLFFNNAGVGVFDNTWECSLTDWQWVVDVNLWGAIYGIRTFVPLMLAQGTPSYIVNTASAAGLTADHFGPDRHGLGPYTVTKFGVVGLTETLRVELAVINAPLKVAVLCPGYVNTGIINRERVRPAAYQGTATGTVASEEEVQDGWSQLAKQAKVITPDILAEGVFSAIREERFYILTDPAFNDDIRHRMEEILDPRNVIDS